MPNLHLALIHHPVLNKNGEVIASAVTNLDLHDIGRAAKTYAAGSFYVVTPLADQAVLVQRILDHWVQGPGAAYNPQRRLALEAVRLRSSLEAVIRDIATECGRPPRLVATSAKTSDGCIGFDRLRERLEAGVPHLLLLGTAWGLSKELLRIADERLTPIRGAGHYNHLSVRSAAAIILDRLTREPELIQE